MRFPYTAEITVSYLSSSKNESLDYLCTEFQDRGARKMFCGPTSHGRYFASFECDEHLADPNSLITVFWDMIGSLDERAASQWQAADSKVFDIGYEADAEQGNFRSDISQEVGKRVADAGAALRITLYPKIDASKS